MTTLPIFIEKANEILSSISVENLEIRGYVNAEDLDLTDGSEVFSQIRDILEDKNAFDVEIIYYSRAIEYLMANDNSLRESLELASDMGYEAKNLNSEILASLLASQNCRNEFQEHESEITSAFEDLQEEIEEYES